jgi:prepilin peptidase CpaA
MSLALTAFHIAVLLAAAVLLVTAAVSDARRYRIPNIVCAALIALFPLFVLTAPRAVEWRQHLIIFTLVLISGFAMFIGNLAGAGDIKLLAATGLWAGPHLVAVFLIITAISGGFLAIVMALLTYMRNVSGTSRIALSKVPIPYGIAIAAGGLSIIYLTSQPILFPS